MSDLQIKKNGLTADFEFLNKLMGLFTIISNDRIACIENGIKQIFIVKMLIFKQMIVDLMVICRKKETGNFTVIHDPFKKQSLRFCKRKVVCSNKMMFFLRKINPRGNIFCDRGSRFTDFVVNGSKQILCTGGSLRRMLNS